MPNVVLTQKNKGKKRAPEPAPLDVDFDARAQGAIVWVRLEHCLQGNLQCRTDLGNIDALTDSIRQRGVLEPMKVRPRDLAGYREFHKELGPDYAMDLSLKGWLDEHPEVEIIDGHRRKLAAERAGVTEVHVMLWAWGDQEALEIQAASLEREPYHPLDEAKLFDRMLGEYGGDTARLAKQVGRTKSYVERTLALTKAAPKVQEALRTGQLDLEVAKSIARIPSSKLQLEALADVLPRPDRPAMSEQAARAHIVRRYMLVLSDAPFDPTNKHLLHMHGMPCTKCERNTAVQRDLFADVGSELAMCTDSICWERKADAAWNLAKGEALEEGKQVIESGEASRFLPAGGPEQAGFVALDSTARALSAETWRKVLTDVCGEIPAADIVLVRDQNGHAVELVSRAFVEGRVKEVRKAGGTVDVPALPPDPEKEKQKAADEKRKGKDRLAHREAALAAIVDRSEREELNRAADPNIAHRARIFARALVEKNAFSHGQPVAKRRGLSLQGCTAREALLAEVERQPASWLSGLIAELTLRDYMLSASSERATSVCEAWDVNFADLRPGKKAKKAQRHEGEVEQ